MTADSGSTWRAAFTCRVPTGIQDQYVKTTGPVGWATASARMTAIATPKAAATTPTPITETAALAVGRTRASSPFRTNPRRGRRGTAPTRAAAVRRLRPPNGSYGPGAP